MFCISDSRFHSFNFVRLVDCRQSLMLKSAQQSISASLKCNGISRIKEVKPWLAHDDMRFLIYPNADSITSDEML